MAEKSNGTFAQSHFRNSRASTSLFEPVYQNLFTFEISLPAGIGASEEEKNLLLENVQKISGLQSDSFPSNLVTQNFKWAQRRFAGGKPERTTMDISLDFEVNLDKNNSAYVLKTLRKWNDLVYDPLTGRTGLKADYVAPWGLITIYNRASVPTWQWRIKDIFPMTPIVVPEWAYTSNDIWRITGYTLACDFFDESIV
jgi:hypothetical protein